MVPVTGTFDVPSSSGEKPVNWWEVKCLNRERDGVSRWTPVRRLTDAELQRQVEFQEGMAYHQSLHIVREVYMELGYRQGFVDGRERGSAEAYEKGLLQGAIDQDHWRGWTR